MKSSLARKVVLKCLKMLTNMVFYGSFIVVVFLLLRVFLFTGFRISTASMHPTLIPSDYVLVDKISIGARLFNVFDVIKGKKVDIFRIPSYGFVKRNDIVVFHIPYSKSWKKINMNMFDYYVKRCIGLPGDTLKIENGIYVINSTNDHYGNIKSQVRMNKKKYNSFSGKVYNTYPLKNEFKWNIKMFGPLYIPQKGDTVLLNDRNISLYKKLIEWESGTLPVCSEKLYVFTHNYYFMGGDNVENSKDSRYWGLLPDDLIVGKVIMIINWKRKMIKLVQNSRKEGGFNSNRFIH